MPYDAFDNVTSAYLSPITYNSSFCLELLNYPGYLRSSSGTSHIHSSLRGFALPKILTTCCSLLFVIQLALKYYLLEEAFPDSLK